MRKNNYILLLLSITLIQTNSCKKIDIGSYKFNPKILGTAIKTSVKGSVDDEYGNKVSGAIVTAGSQTVTTDIAGVFILEDIDAFEKIGYVKVEKQGYFTGSRSFVPATGGASVTIRLLSNRKSGTISASTGGKVSAEGVEVNFTPGIIVKNKVRYSGTVNVSIQYINPTSEFFEEEMPGNLYGVKNDELMGLTSYGMVGVELKDDSGQPLQIAEGEKATVSFSIPATLVSSAPSSIDLWSFDEENGFWKNEGVAKKQNDKYVAEVSHFSFWNCDIPWNFVTIKGKVKLEGSDFVLQGFKVVLTSSSIGFATSITNELGIFGGYVPKNETLKIDIYYYCANGTGPKIYSGTIGPFSTDIIIPDIFTQGNLITGNVVNCNNEIQNTSYVFANGQLYFTSNGKFSFLACGSSISITPYTSFPSTSGIPLSVQVKGGVQNIGNLQSCNTFGGATGTISDVDGNIYNTIKIGDQEWMAENLTTSRYRNGDPLIKSYDAMTICESTVGIWSYLENDSVSFKPHGKLYNWFSIVDSRGLCPSGWHVPTDAEWDQLINTAGGFKVAGKYLKSVNGALWYNDNYSSTNTTGFSATGGGYNGVECSVPEFSWFGFSGVSTAAYNGVWWSITDNPPFNNNSKPFVYIMTETIDEVYKDSSLMKQNLFSIRCIKD
jgi:uncharacterized protein (TIGR02145 family)